MLARARSARASHARTARCRAWSRRVRAQPSRRTGRRPARPCPVGRLPVLAPARAALRGSCRAARGPIARAARAPGTPSSARFWRTPADEGRGPPRLRRELPQRAAALNRRTACAPFHRQPRRRPARATPPALAPPTVAAGGALLPALPLAQTGDVRGVMLAVPRVQAQHRVERHRTILR